MNTDYIESPKEKINRRYDRFTSKAVLAGLASGLLAIGTLLYGTSIRPRISENPYKNNEVVIQYTQTKEDLRKARNSKRKLISLHYHSNLDLEYVPKELESKLEELSTKSETERLASLIEGFGNYEQEAKKNLENLWENEKVKNYHHWKNGDDLLSWVLGLMGLAVTSIMSMNVAAMIKKRKLSNLES